MKVGTAMAKRGIWASVSGGRLQSTPSTAQSRCTLGWWYNCQGWFAGPNKAAKFRGLKGFVAKRRKSAYRSRPIGGLDQSHVPSLAKVNRDRGQRLFTERRRA